VRHRIRENMKGEHAGQRTDYFRARSVLYLLPTLPRTGLRITPPPDATCKPLEAILVAVLCEQGPLRGGSTELADVLYVVATALALI
jgi:hypothetical protein